MNKHKILFHFSLQPKTLTNF